MDYASSAAIHANRDSRFATIAPQKCGIGHDLGNADAGQCVPGNAAGAAMTSCRPQENVGYAKAGNHGLAGLSLPTTQSMAALCIHRPQMVPATKPAAANENAVQK